jgi:membrane-bound lytic murein transglycosylase A
MIVAEKVTPPRFAALATLPQGEGDTLMRTSFLRAFILISVLLLTACAEKPTPPSKLDLKPVSFEQLPGWSTDRVSEALPALQKSCSVILKQAADKPRGIAGTVADWQAACTAIQRTAPDEAAVRQVLQQQFRPYAVRNVAWDQGLFTGYYEPLLKGSRTATAQFHTPLWQMPHDMLSADLGAFKPELAGQKITGKVNGSRFVPYDDRAAIAAGALQGRAEPLVWVDDPIAAFFLEIQGSGRVSLPDGSVLQVGYAAQNGRPYVPIGRVLAEQGKIERPVSMQKIRAWLQANPGEAQAIKNHNPSAVFFRELKTGAVGAQGVELTPRRSLAVDPNFIPLGTPLWLTTDNGLRQLVVAQDTGGAIKGAVRGDYFWGHGPEAEQQAGEMQAKGTYYLLLPQAVTP